MPRDINGVYTLPTGNPVVPGTVISTTWANATLNDIAAALTQSATKDNSVLTGIPTAPTPVAGTNTTQLATTAFVQSQKTTSATDTTSGRVWRTDDLVKTTSTTDTTAGRVTKVGDFGWLGGSVLEEDIDCNYLVIPGVHNAKIPALNRPGPDYGYYIRVSKRFNANILQEAIANVLPPTTGNPTAAYRTSTDGGTSWGAWVEVATSANSLGQGQTWQNVTGIRALQTTYTNTTGRPIEICVTTYNTTGTCSVSLIVNGVTLGFNQLSLAGSYTSMSGVVPVGGQYIATNGGAQSTLYSWSELR